MLLNISRIVCVFLSLTALCALAQSPLGSNLVLSKLAPDSQSRYLLTYREDTPNGWISSLIEVTGAGTIRYLWSTPPNRNRDRVTRLHDLRFVGGRYFFFASHAAFDGQREAPYTEACELSPAGEKSNCYEHKYLDIHDRLFAANGDTIYMFHEPRPNWQGRVFEARPLDLVLRRIAPGGKVVWEWSSAAHYDAFQLRQYPIDVKSKVHDYFSKMIRFLRTGNLISRVWSRITLMIENGANGALERIGLFHEPLCIRLLGECIVSPPYTDDYVHGNSLEWAEDGGIIISAARQHAIFKIGYPEGNLVWSIGGYATKGGTFTIKNDPLGGFSFQHSVRRLPNGNIVLYDNGTERPEEVSRATEWQLDFSRMTASLVWERRTSNDYPHRLCCGAVERLPNGNTLISWGGWDGGIDPKNGSIPIATEVDRENRIVFEIRSKTLETVYRVWAAPKL